jgi:YVTN family beta-propeller protein
MAVEDVIAAGEIVAGYRIEALVGSGGTGEVYRARDSRLERPVALKLLAPRVASDDRFRERLLRESRLAASLDHPNVIPVYEAGESDGRLFIAMRYVDGIDLRALLRQHGALEASRTIDLARQVAAALDAAHERGLVHRDVKPSNVLIDRPGTQEHCYLADFGLTQSASDTGPTEGQLMGTIDYVAPEQIRGDRSDGRADQYALACLVFECLTGTLPHHRDSSIATLFAHLEEPPPAASERRSDLPSGVDAVLARAMAKLPEERFETCGSFVDAAADALGLEEQPARRRWPLAAVVVAALAALASTAALLLTGSEPASAAPVGALVQIDAATNAVVNRTSVRGHPGQLAVGPGGIWVSDFRTGALWRYEPRTEGLESIATSGEPRDLAVHGDSVYVAFDGPKQFSGTVARYDVRTGVREDGLSILACAIASGEGVVWVAGCPFVQRLSTDDRPMRKLLEVFLPYARGLTAENHRIQFRELVIGGGSVWVLGDPLDRRLWRLDARTGKILATIALPFPPRTVAFGGGVVWITDPLGDRVVPIEPASNRVGAGIRVGLGASGVAATDTAVWVANSLDGTISRVDPRARRVVATIQVGGLPKELAVSAGAVWVAVDGR